MPSPQSQKLSGSVSALGLNSNVQKVMEAGAYTAQSSHSIQHNLTPSCSTQDVPPELHAHLSQPLAGVFCSAGHPGRVLCLAQQQRLQETCCNSSTPRQMASVRAPPAHTEPPPPVTLLPQQLPGCSPSQDSRSSQGGLRG